LVLEGGPVKGDKTHKKTNKTKHNTTTQTHTTNKHL